VQLTSQRNRSLISSLLLANAMPLQLNVHVVLSEGLYQALHNAASLVHATARQ
jgi:hypothetical protein